MEIKFCPYCGEAIAKTIDKFIYCSSCKICWYITISVITNTIFDLMAKVKDAKEEE